MLGYKQTNKWAFLIWPSMSPYVLFIVYTHICMFLCADCELIHRPMHIYPSSKSQSILIPPTRRALVDSLVINLNLVGGRLPTVEQVYHCIIEFLSHHDSA
ncbi:BnaC05g11380D [Brassica napus]|uniref:(rape) hypothetical protein n=1 Tax=Brassica napus TaxID=3708 RepID=A0A078HQI6_BRANA|nr:unnamed protein product [Brassica napus]CDY39609.1 BnaC05g11380D [Brassica napus]